MSYSEVTWGAGSLDSSNYPPEVGKNMRPDDEVVAFISIVGKDTTGCLRKKTQDNGNRNFVAITHERIIGTVQTLNVLEESRLKTKTETVTVTFNVPLVKVTSLTTSSSSTDVQGCLKKSSKSKRHYLHINAQGDEISFYTGPDCTVNDQIIRSFLEVSDYF